MPYLYIFHINAAALLYIGQLRVAVDAVLQEFRQVLSGVIVKEQFLVVHTHLLFLRVAHIRSYSTGTEQSAAQLFVVRTERQYP